MAYGERYPGEDWSWDEPWTLGDSTDVAGYRQAGVDGKDLHVWFHKEGRVYEYVGAGHLYVHMKLAPSRGKFVWTVLRRAGRYLYNRIG